MDAIVLAHVNEPTRTFGVFPSATFHSSPVVAHEGGGLVAATIGLSGNRALLTTAHSKLEQWGSTRTLDIGASPSHCEDCATPVLVSVGDVDDDLLIDFVCALPTHDSINLVLCSGAGGEVLSSTQIKIPAHSIFHLELDFDYRNPDLLLVLLRKRNQNSDQGEVHQFFIPDLVRFVDEEKIETYLLVSDPVFQWQLPSQQWLSSFAFDGRNYLISLETATRIPLPTNYIGFGTVEESDIYGGLPVLITGMSRGDNAGDHQTELLMCCESCAAWSVVAGPVSVDIPRAPFSAVAHSEPAGMIWRVIDCPTYDFFEPQVSHLIEVPFALNHVCVED